MKCRLNKDFNYPEFRRWPTTWDVRHRAAREQQLFHWSSEPDLFWKSIASICASVHVKTIICDMVGEKKVSPAKMSTPFFFFFLSQSKRPKSWYRRKRADDFRAKRKLHLRDNISSPTCNMGLSLQVNLCNMRWQARKWGIRTGGKKKSTEYLGFILYIIPLASGDFSYEGDQNAITEETGLR